MSREQVSTLREQATREWDAFRNVAVPRILVGAATCGRAAGAIAVREAFETALKTRRVEAQVSDVGCLGLCYAEPLVEIALPDGRRMLYADVAPEHADELVRDVVAGGQPRADMALAVTGSVPVDGIPPLDELPMLAGQQRVVLRNAGVIDPTRLEHYLARDGYRGLERALGMTPEAVIACLRESGLRGRGGAGFETGLKWELARKAPGTQKYVICNADEGDPGAFMDRAVLESDPHAVLEGLAVAAYAVGASEAVVYVRAEYPLAVERLETAIRQMTEAGYAGDRVLGTPFSLSIRIKQGAGAFVCGEETALIASCEGRRGMPRPRPPFPAQSGLHGCPTSINNVETLANVPCILSRGAAWFRGFGTEKSPGTKTFALAGKIARTGLIEVPMGMPLRTIIESIGGGVPDGKAFKAVQTGGPSGGCLPAAMLDLPVDYERLAEAGSIMGSGGMIVLDSDSCMVDIARYFLEFTNRESCGKCTPCRMGSEHLLRLLGDICDGRGRAGDIDKLERLAATVRAGSLCGLGQTLANPVLSTLRYFRDEFEAHVVRKECRATVCKGIISSPCQYTCPIHQDVPAYIGFIARGEFDRAIEVIRRENPFPGICGRVCPHMCEERCEAGKYGDPIAIRALKRFAADYEREHGSLPTPPERRYGETVAVVGAGPAGLTAAYYLARRGYAVTVFEALSEPGGMLRVGIPEYRLPRDILQQEIAYIEHMGVTIRTGMRLGENLSVDALLEQGFNAVFVAVGAHRPSAVSFPGSDHPRVLPGVDFLHRLNMGEHMALGSRVAVIGGGNVASDSARSAVRLGGSEVFILYRRTRAEMPALPEELQQLEEEGIRIEFLVAPVKTRTEDGVLKGLECRRMQLGEPDASGRRRPVPVEGSDFFVECDDVILAVGQVSDVDFADADALPVTGSGTLRADPDTLQTAREGVFAGGDVVSGPANVVTAIAHGKQAAASIHQYLRGQPVARRFDVIRPAVDVEPVELTDAEIEQLARPEIPCRPGAIRVRDLLEVEQALCSKAAVLEAKRCLRCDHE